MYPLDQTESREMLAMDPEALSRVFRDDFIGDGVPAAWCDVAADVLARGGIAMALGEPDTGKSSFVFWLARRAAELGLRPWVVDADVGQSEIGPPGTIACAPIPADLPSNANAQKPALPLQAAAMFFVGSTSPKGHLLPMVTGTVRAVEDAWQKGANLVVVNTTGYVREPPAVAMKIAKIDAVRPHALLVFGALSSVAPILHPYRFMRRPRIHMCPSSPALEHRTPAQRDAAREQNWRSYFAPGLRRKVMLSEIGLSGMEPEAFHLRDLRGRVVGLFAPSGACRAVGIIIRQREDSVEVFTPLAGDVPIARLHLGDVELSPDDVLT